MSYAIEWEPDVRSFLLGLTDQAFVTLVLDAADRLAAAPTRLSRAGGPPYYGIRQRDAFTADGRNVALLFLFDQDEQRLHVVEVSIRPRLG